MAEWLLTIGLLFQCKSFQIKSNRTEKIVGGAQRIFSLLHP